MHKFTGLNIAAAFIILLAGAGCKHKANESNSNLTDVEIQHVKISDTSQQIRYSGTIEESEKIPLAFPVFGTVSSVLVSEGDYVRKGQILAVLDSDNYKNTLDLAVASEKQAEDAFRRLQNLYNNGNLPEIKLVETETNLKKARAQSAIAGKNLKDCNLYTPADGIISRRFIEPGMSATQNLTTIEIVKIDTVYARISVSENEISYMKKGQRASIKIGALGDITVAGIVRETGIVSDSLSHTYKVKIAIPNPGLRIKPGMICDVTVEKKGVSRGYMVPSGAVMVDESGKNYVYLVNTSMKAVKKHVRTGRLLNEGIEVNEGIRKGDVLVVSGQHKLVDDSPVNIMNRSHLSENER